MPTAEQLLDTAIAQRDTAVLAAAARAGAKLPKQAQPAVAGLRDDGVQVSAADAHGQCVLSLTDAVTADPEGTHLSPAFETPKLRKAMLALLAGTRDPESPWPYPGRPAATDDVVTLARPGSEPARRHLLGALRTLTELGFATFDADGTQVRPGPVLASWRDDWTRDELPTLLDRLHSGTVAS